jgi:hypothetical protein
VNSEDWEGRIVHLDDRRPVPPGFLDRYEDLALLLLACVIPVSALLGALMYWT